MPVDNDLYNRQADGWWREDHFLHTLKTGLNPARFGYFRQVMAANGLKTQGLRVLEVGSGGGILSEEFARLGCKVHGIDLSHASAKIALEHSKQGKLSNLYLTGQAERLPLTPGYYDVVACCDVLEHVRDLEAVIAECARMLRSGGYFFFDTINRTPQSYLETILVAQALPFTRFFAPNTHDWARFVKPAELEQLLGKHDLAIVEVTGLGPGINPALVLVEILRLKLKQINFGEFGRRLKFKAGIGTGGSYIGFARRK